MRIISKEIEALKAAMNSAIKGAFIVSCVEKIKPALDFLTKAQEDERQYGSIFYQEAV